VRVVSDKDTHYITFQSIPLTKARARVPRKDHVLSKKKPCIIKSGDT
jgi:hypothetical protein